MASSALADASISESKVANSGRKPPPKRTTVAIADTAVTPEPR